jgi:hypothetical protein
MATDRPHWIIGVREEIPELESYKRGWVQVTPRAMPFNVYASGATTRVVTPKQPAAPLLVAKLAQDEELAGELALHRISAAEFNALRSLYLDKRIAPGAPPYPADRLGRVDGVLRQPEQREVRSGDPGDAADEPPQVR